MKEINLDNYTKEYNDFVYSMGDEINRFTWLSDNKAKFIFACGMEREKEKSSEIIKNLKLEIQQLKEK